MSRCSYWSPTEVVAVRSSPASHSQTAFTPTLKFVLFVSDWDTVPRKPSTGSKKASGGEKIRFSWLKKSAPTLEMRVTRCSSSS